MQNKFYSKSRKAQVRRNEPSPIGIPIKLWDALFSRKPDHPFPVRGEK